MNTILRDFFTNDQGKGVKTMKKHMWFRGLALALVFLFTASTAYPAADVDPNAGTETRHIHYQTITDSMGRVIGKTGYQEFSGVDLEGYDYSGKTTFTYAMKAGHLVMTQSVTNTESHGETEQGNPYTTVSTNTTNYTFNSKGQLSGGSTSSSYTTTVRDTNGALVSTTTGSSHSTSTEIRNGQLLVLGTSGTSTTTDKDGKVVANGTVTVTNVYGNYSGGSWNLTSTRQVSTSTSVGTNETSTTDITTRMGYDQYGNLTSQSASGSRKGTTLTSSGWLSYERKITITYKIKNGVAVEDVYDEQ